MEINIRKEGEQDFRRVEEVAREAFWNLYLPGAQEHCVVNKLRKSPDVIKELCFVIEVDGEVEGAIYYTHSRIENSNKENINTISFGPVFISPNYHRRGLGRRLITHSIEMAKKMGYRGIITLGYPYHYEPYGFVGGKKYKIAMADGKFYTGLLALPLYEGAFDYVSGVACFTKDLDVTEEEVEVFEKSFPYKQKQYLACQEEFQIACAEIDA